MADRSILHLALLCLGVFTSVLVSLQLYFAVIDEENSIHFSQTDFDTNFESHLGIKDDVIVVECIPTTKSSTCTSTERIDDELLEEVGENDQVEDTEPVHFNYDKNIEDSTFNDPHKQAQDEDLPIVIWWTRFPHSDTIQTCDQGKCYITENRSLQNDIQTKAFLFYGTDFDANDLPLPRRADDEWGLLHEESPKNNPILFHEETIVLFNHTSTFRRHSDYPLFTHSLESISVLENAPWYTLEEKAVDRSPVVYVQSGCNPPSDREAYVQELMKYIRVDSLGQCLNNKELPAKYKNTLTFEDKGFFQIVAKYKFTLAFENAICDDYLTEKIWRPLEIGSVPIYRGSPSVLDWMPNNHSVILVDDFPGPRELAEFIKKLDDDDALYLEFLEFKKKGGVTNMRLLEHMEHRRWGITDTDPHFVAGFACFVCDRLHANIRRQRAGLSMLKHVANQDHFGCPRSVLFDLPPPKGTDQFERDMWALEYDQYIQVARDMNRAVLSGQKTFRYRK